MDFDNLILYYIVLNDVLKGIIIKSRAIFKKLKTQHKRLILNNKYKNIKTSKH